MALPNLSGSNIQDTYQRVLQTNGTLVYDGTGSVLPISFESGDLNAPNGTLILGPSHGTIKAYGDETWFYSSGLSESSRATTFKSQLKLPDKKGISFGIDNDFNIEHAEDPNRLVFQTTNSGSVNTRLTMGTNGDLTHSANFSSSGDIYAADYFDDGININTIYAPIASPSFTGNITASGNISSSGIVTGLSGSFSHINLSDLPASSDNTALFVKPDGTVGTKELASNAFTNDALVTQGVPAANVFVYHDAGRTMEDSILSQVGTTISATGDISASGDLFFNNIDGGTF